MESHGKKAVMESHGVMEKSWKMKKINKVMETEESGKKSGKSHGICQGCHFR